MMFGVCKVILKIVISACWKMSCDEEESFAGGCGRFDKISVMSVPTPTIRTLWSIGHSNHPFERFVALLTQHEIEVLVDVRTSPYSKYAPQFGREAMSAALARVGVKYLYLGKELGGRPVGSRYYAADGRVLYDELAKSELFRAGADRLEQGLTQYRCAIMCSEENPCVCHRHLLVSRVMRARGVEVRHVRGNGRMETFEEVERGTKKGEERVETLWGA
jgi:uncharacterized protein (DUF488 family)